MKDELYRQLLNDGKRYLQSRYDLLRLELLEKLSRIIALLLMVFTSMILLLAAFFYFSFALMEWLGSFVGRIPAVCIIGGFFVLLLLAGFIFRKQLFLNPMIRLLSDILFREPQPSETPNTPEPEADNEKQ